MFITQKFGNGTANGDTTSVNDDESTTEVACQFVPAVLRDAPSGVESSYDYINQPRSYGTRPRDENGLTNEAGVRSDEDSPRARQSSLYQDYSQAKVSHQNWVLFWASLWSVLTDIYNYIYKYTFLCYLYIDFFFF